MLAACSSFSAAAAAGAVAKRWVHKYTNTIYTNTNINTKIFFGAVARMYIVHTLHTKNPDSLDCIVICIVIQGVF